MTATRDVESFGDFCQYYNHRFFKSRRDQNKIYYLNGKINQTTVSLAVYVEGKLVKDGELMTAEQIWDDMQFGLPLIGMTERNNELLYLYYRTNRHGARGYDSNRILTHSHNSWVLSRYGLPVHRREDINTPGFACAALTQRHKTLYEAWRDFTSPKPNKLAYALSYRFGVHLCEDEYPKLCYKIHDIGEVTGPWNVRLNKQYAEYKDVILRVLNRNMEIQIV